MEQQAAQPVEENVVELGERLLRNEEATGSIPVSSTKLQGSGGPAIWE